MKTFMKTPLFAALLASASVADAGLNEFQNEVNSGTQPTATRFTTVSGTAPELIDVGALSGDMSFEFIANAGLGGISSAFLGNRNANGSQGLKFEQCCDQLVLGMTNFGVIDLYSDDQAPLFTDTHFVFTSDGTDTNLYVNGTNVFTFAGFPLQIFGEQGLAGVINSNATFNDVLDGNILSFASYDSALTPAEIATHSNAFFIPEPSTFAVAALAGAGIILRRRRERV